MKKTYPVNHNAQAGKSCSCEQCNAECKICGGITSDHKHKKNTCVPANLREKKIEETSKKGYRIMRIKPMESENKSKKGRRLK